MVARRASALIRSLERSLAKSGSSLNALAPRVRVDPDTHAAILGTNEANAPTLYRQLREANRQSGCRANGYLVGVGVANALSAISAFEPGTGPRGIVLLDVDPRVVVAGRVLIALLSSTTSLGRLVARLGDAAGLSTLITRVVAEESNPRVRARFEAVDVPQLTALLMERRDTLAHPAAFRSSNVSMVRALRRHFQAFRRCARDGRFVVLLGDVTNTTLTQAVAELPRYATSNNVVYLSNVIDAAWVHAGPRGVRRYTEAVARLAPNRGHRNTYLATSYNQAYDLQTYAHPPVVLVQRERRGLHWRGDLVYQADADANARLGPFRAFDALALTVGTDATSVIRFPTGLGVAVSHLRITCNGRTGRWSALAHAAVRVRRTDGATLSRRRFTLNDGDALTLSYRATLVVSIENSDIATNAVGLRVRYTRA